MEVNDVQALEKISSEVDESQIKVILSSQCIKAQVYLLDKLKKQAERHKETCGFISSANFKLEAEIKQAELEINSMLIAEETIKLANVEMRKEWLVAKARKLEIIERTQEGTKRYEDLWLASKARYESIPFVQKLLCAKEKVKAQNNDIDSLDKQITSLYELMKTQRETFINLDKKRCIELANYMVNEMPNTIKIITEKSDNIIEMTRQIKEIIAEQKTVADAAIVTAAAEAQNLEKIHNKNKDMVQDDDLNKSEEDALIPKLELTNFDFDIIDVNLEAAKIKNDEIPSAIILTTDPVDYLVNNKMEHCREDEKAYEYVTSPYFNSYKEKESHNFSKRKLINILEDVHINNDEVYNIVKKVNPENLRTTYEISVNDIREKPASAFSKDTPIESDTIEEVDMTCSNAANNIIIPPTQFLDITLTSSQESLHKKRVSFDIPSSIQINEVLIDDVDKQNNTDENEAANQTVNSQLDASVASEDSYVKIQDMILKKHNLDLSPQFVYAKNPVLQKRDGDQVVASKFFVTENQEVKTDEVSDNRMEIDEEAREPEPKEKLKESQNLEELNLKDNMPMDLDEMIASSPKKNKKQEEPRPENPLPGLLFNHERQAIPESLNASMSTTGYDDSDFPHCIDSSLLLSPKADIPMTDNPDVQSQEVPNFLSGFRKTGLAFFGGGSATSSDPKPDTSDPNNGNNFSFNFVGEKKNRGGLFSLFN